ncbi:MAG: hypothetical protein ACT4P1_14435 [Sporichthyaceae bacterium]
MIDAWVAASDALVLWAATESPQPFDQSKVEPGFIGLAFFLAMAAAVVALVFSMRNRLKNIDVTRHGREQQSKQAPAGPPDPDSPIS